MSLLRKLAGPPRVSKCLSRMLVSGLMFPFVVVRHSSEVSMRGKIVEFSGRMIYQQVRGRFPRIKLVAGIWGFKGDTESQGTFRKKSTGSSANKPGPGS